MTRRCAPGLGRVAAVLLGGLVAWGSPLARGAEAVDEPDGYWAGDLDAPVPTTLRGGSVVHAVDVADLLRTGTPVVVDVSNAPQRPAALAPGAPWMPVPHRGLPHALWFPGVGAGAITAELDAFFRSSLASATKNDLDATIVVYCHERCWLSWNAARRAIGYGYHRVAWFADGIEGWTAAGQATAVILPQLPDASPAGAANLPSLVVLDMELTGDLGGPDFEVEHTARLKSESMRLRAALERTGRYRVQGTEAAQETLDRLRSQQAYLHDCNGCDLDVGRELKADLVLVAWVDRVSGLILSLTYEIHDVKTGQITARKSFDFRGDNDNAWNHAIDYLVRDLRKSQETT